MSRRSHISHSDYASNEDYASQALVSGERFCAPRANSRGSILRMTALVLAVGLGGAWAATTYPAEWQALVTTAKSLAEHRAPMPAEAAAPTPAPVAEAHAEPPPLPADTRDVQVAPGATAGEAAPSPPPEKAAAATPEPQPIDDKPVPLPKPKPDPSDPNQKRALAAGLHPDISRSLLARLTAADYRNASKAIKTALAETADAEVYKWPRVAGEALALFEVHFVKGAGPECRRYVVVVTKNRWSTTAPAMEKCGSELPKRKTVIKASG